MLDVLYWKAVLVGLWLAAFFVFERLKPASPWKASDSLWHFSQRRHLVQNLALWLINVVLSPLLVIPLTLLAVDLAFTWRPQQPQGAIGWALDLLVLDLWLYAWHRANHSWSFLWRFHRVHHLDEQLDSTSALRFHFGEVVLSAVARIPVIIFLGIEFSHLLAFETLVIVAAIFHHSNIRLSGGVEKGLSSVLITPAIHWVHHRAVRADTDSNYGTLLSCWDRVFQSRSTTVRDPTMSLGVEGQRENSPLQLLLLPFLPIPGARRP